MRANWNVHNAVRTVSYGDVFRGVIMAVSRAVSGVVHQDVVVVVDDAVSWAMCEAVGEAARGDPQHLPLRDFLADASAEAM